MNRLRMCLVRLRGVFSRAAGERRIAEELESHLQLDIDDGIRRGLDPAEARRQALLRLGGVESTKESLREQYGHPWLENAVRDLTFAVRTMLRSPGLTGTIVLTLALGTGATTAIFTVVNGVLLRPLPYPQPERLVSISAKLEGFPADNVFAYTVDYPAWRKYSRTLSEIAGYMNFQANMARPGGAERVDCGFATASLFSLLGVRPALGRVFRPDEDSPGGPDVALLEYSFWQSHFAGDPAILAKSVVLDDRVYTIVGVLPPSFVIPDLYAGRNPYQIWIPFGIPDSGRARDIMMRVVGRMRPGVEIAAARSDLNALMRGAIRRGARWKSAGVIPWQEQIASGVKRSLVMFLAAVGFVLLIACVNVANLLLGNSAARSREMSLRRALGAGSGRIVRQLLTESVLLSVVGALVGLAFAQWAKQLVLLVIAPKMPALAPIGLDYRVFLFALAVAVVTGVAFGMAPAFAVLRVHLSDSLNQAGRGIAGSRWTARFRRTLAVAEIALAMVLLSGAGLFLRSFLYLRGIGLGVNPDRLLTFSVNPTKSHYPTDADRARYLDRLLAAMHAVPGVESAAGGSGLPLSGADMTFSGLPIEGRENAPMVNGTLVTGDYFRTLGIPLIRGRAITKDDRPGAPSVVVVSETFARQFLPSGGALGHRIGNPLRDNGWLTVVGLVADVRPGPESEPEPLIYLPYLQFDTGQITKSGEIPFAVMLRTSVPPAGIAPAIRRVAAGIDAAQPLYDLATFEDLRSRWVAPRRVNAILIAVFAGLALMLGSIGIYGVLSHAVGERTHEFGIRIALGARSAEVTAMVLRGGIQVIAAGIALGLLGSLLLSRSIAGELFGVRPADPWTFAAVALILSAVGVLACAIPARRAAKVDPVIALRCE